MNAINYTEVGGSAYDIVENLFRSVEGKEIGEYLDGVDLADYLYSINGKDRLKEEVPNKPIYSSINVHFTLFLSDYVDIPEMLERMNESLAWASPEEFDKNEKVLRDGGEAVEYLLIMIRRKRLLMEARGVASH